MEREESSQQVIGGGDGPSQFVSEEVEGHSQIGNERISSSSIMPIVDDILKPKVGMSFKSLEEASLFYETYGKAAGFDIRSSSTQYSKERELIAKKYVCAKEGKTMSRGNDIRRFNSIRTNCKAKISLKLEKERGMWIIQNFVEEHNHEVTTPRRQHLLKGNLTVCNAKKRLVKQVKEVNIPTSKTIALLKHESGGYEGIGCTEKDIRNYEIDLKVATKGHDAQMLRDHFEFAQEKDPSFYYAMKTDDENKLTHVFWVDAIARKNYKLFSDVVTFDTTHETNQYGLIWAPFIGVNHHLQSMFLGCGFIPNESVESFVWIFEKFLEAMDKAPDGIVTDQDLGIRAALARTFPNTRHQLCMWHIMEKLRDKLGSWAYNENFMTSFKACVWQSLTVEEFEDSWMKLLTETGLISNDWLMSLWNIRHLWIPVFQKPYFWAGISSSQRSESINALLKMNVSRNNTLLEFVTIFDRALARQRERELLEDHNSLDKKPMLKTRWAMEEQMSKVYTRTIFYIFQEEVKASWDYTVIIISENAGVTKYKVFPIVGEEDVSEERVVTYSQSTQLSTCTCMELEWKGIPCRHVLAYLKYSAHRTLPEGYILKRWTKDIKRNIVLNMDGNVFGGGSGQNYSSHFIELKGWAQKVVNEASSSEATYNYTLSSLQDIYQKIQSLKLKDVGEDKDQNEREPKRSISSIEMLDPDQAKTKGRRKGKRMKAARENPKQRSTKCTLCGKRGQKHDKRNRPYKNKSVSEAQVNDTLDDGLLGNSSEEEFDDEDSTQSLSD